MEHAFPSILQKQITYILREIYLKISAGSKSQISPQQERDILAFTDIKLLTDDETNKMNLKIE